MLNINPLSSHMGVEVLNLNLKDNNIDKIVSEIKALLDKHHIVVMRNLQMTPEDQIEFCGKFGDIEKHPLAENTIQYPEMTIISNVVEDGKNLGYQGPKFELWHSDMCYYEQVSSMTFLYAYSVPEKNGETLFSNMQLAYQELDDELKNKITGKYAVFGSSENLMKRCQERGYDLHIAPEDQNPDVIHPVVITHPNTEIPSIYVNWTHTDKILELDEPESQTILNKLYEHCHQGKYRYVHDYKPGDLIVWDNYAVIHTGSAQPPIGKRIMRRVAIKGVRPTYQNRKPPSQFKNYISVMTALMIFMIGMVFHFPGFALNSKTKELIKQMQVLTEVNAPSGFEKPMREFLKKKWLDEKFYVKIDGLGNVIASPRHLKNDIPTVLVVAHMDEVGLLVKDIDERGFFSFEMLGGWVTEALTSQKWIVTNEKGKPVVGFTGLESGHIIEGFPETPKTTYKSLFMDVGASSKKELMEEFFIRPGLPIVPSTKFEILNEKYIAAKALDDRIGISLLMDLLSEFKRKSLDYNLVFAATVQEEVGMRGAEVLYASVKPDLVFNIDIALAKDFPMVLRKSRHEPGLGLGPVFYTFDSSSIPDPIVFDFVKNFAVKNKLPFQYAVETNTGLDSCSIQRKGDGVLIFNLGVPVRYAHAPYGLMNMQDYFQSFDLLKGIFYELNAKKIVSLKPNFDSAWL